MALTYGDYVITEAGFGEKMPRASQLPALAEALNCTIDDLYNGGKEAGG
jgi:hypothetical protein